MDAPVLVTGITGYIGDRLLRRFEEGGRAARWSGRQPGGLRCDNRGMALLGGIAFVVLMTAAIQGQRPEPVRTVEHVDLNRYLGDWFEIARVPNRFQRTCVGDVRATYAKRADGRLDVTNRCRVADGRVIDALGVARIVDVRTFAKLKVRFAPAVLSFLPFVWGDYWIVGLADDYSWAVVGSPDRRYLWILGRAAALDPGRLASALAAARASGFDVERLIMTSQGAASRVNRDQTP